ncbi:MAG: ABC transporter substrate-binding protein [Candidatus Heimdallarchaeota archaeon]
MTEEKTPKKKKGSKIAEMKKPLIISGLIFSIALTGIIIGFNINSKTTQSGGVLYFLGYGFPYTLDPIDVMDLADGDIINQVAEGLFDLDVNLELIHCLATDHEWSTDGLNLTCTLRQRVEFHDGTPFNAAAVKWNFDRTYRLLDKIMFSFLWLLPDNRPIINETQVLDEYTVKFILNAPYSPLLALFASTFSCIVSPTSTPADDLISSGSGELVGTGPFIFDSFTTNNITLSANPHYWGGKPKIAKLIVFNSINSASALKDSLLAGEIHVKKAVKFNESTLNFFRNNHNFTVSEPINEPFLDFIVMNNKLINITMRRAISYAINYSNYVYNNRYIQAKGPIPESILYYNITGIDVPYYNISAARRILKDGNWPGTDQLTVNNNISAGNEWELLANSSTPLAIYNYSACSNWPRSIWYADPIIEDLKQIGVKIEPFNLSISEWLFIYYEWGGYNRNMIGLFFNFWIADYNDPSTFITEFYTNKKLGDNVGQVNDTIVQEWLEEGLRERDATVRRQLYYKIQKRLIEDVCPNIWLNSRTRVDIYVSNLKDWYPHPFKDTLKLVSFV